jgi:Ca2+-binding EF-hand superfamily protein
MDSLDCFHVKQFELYKKYKKGYLSIEEYLLEIKLLDDMITKIEISSLVRHMVQINKAMISFERAFLEHIHSLKPLIY